MQSNLTEKERVKEKKITFNLRKIARFYNSINQLSKENKL